MGWQKSIAPKILNYRMDALLGVQAFDLDRALEIDPEFLSEDCPRTRRDSKIFCHSRIWRTRWAKTE